MKSDFGHNKKKYVVTRHFNDFLRYCEENPDADVVYLTQSCQIRGLELDDDQIVLYGNKPLNPEIEEILLKRIKKR